MTEKGSQNPGAANVQTHRPQPCLQVLLAGSGLAIFLLVYGINACYNYSIKMSGDEYQYLKSAKALLHGSFTIDNHAFSILKRQFPEMAGRFSCFVINPSGNLVSYYSEGVALFFAPLIALFGHYVFMATPILCDLTAMICLFFLTLLYCKDHDMRYGPAFALLCVSVYGWVIDFHLGIRRDVIGAVLVMVISLLVMTGSRKKKWLYWQSAIALMTFLFTIKVSYGLLYIPLSLILFTEMKGKFGRPRLLLFQALLAGIISAAILAPFFLQNAASTGHWYLVSQSSEASSFVPYEGKGGSWTGWLVMNLVHMARAQSHVYALKGTPAWTAVAFAAFAAFGLWKERKSVIVRFWIAPILAMFYGLYAFTDRTPNIFNLYLAPTYYLAVFLFVLGLWRAMMPLLRQELILALALSLTLGPFLALKTFRIFPGHRHANFRVIEAHSLVADISAVVPPGGILLCDKYLSTVIDYFSPVQSFPAADLKGGKSDEAAKIGFLIGGGIGIYFCDYEGYDFCSYYKPYLQSHFRLNLVKSGQQLYNFSGPANNVSCNVYRVLFR